MEGCPLHLDCILLGKLEASAQLPACTFVREYEATADSLLGLCHDPPAKLRWSKRALDMCLMMLMMLCLVLLLLSAKQGHGMQRYNIL